MKASELRIGNYVIDNCDGNVCQITSGKMIDDGLPFMRPIPLAEQWLLDFGFTDDGIVYMYDVAIDFKITLVPADGFYPQIEKASDTGWGCINLPKIDYVHQLHNLYYSLTGEELTLSPQGYQTH